MPRLIAVVAAAALGTVGALLVASPASAHHPTVRASVVCNVQTGMWDVTWKVKNSESDLRGSIIEVKPAPLSVIKPGTLNLPKSTEAGHPLTEVQSFPSTVNTAWLEVKVKWVRGTGRWQRIIIEKDKEYIKWDGTCGESGPNAAFASDCEQVTVVLSNSANATGPASFTVTRENGTPSPINVGPLAPGTSADPLTFPKSAGFITVVAGNKSFDPYKWTDPGNCGKPTLTAESTCDQLKVTITNPADGVPVNALLDPSTGDNQTFDGIAKGTSQTATFTGSAGLSVLVQLTGVADQTVTWEQPKDCTTTAPPTTTGPPLAVTGASLGGVIGIGVGLLAGGAALIAAFVALRRRRSAGEPAA
jgi:hypothetical protein